MQQDRMTSVHFHTCLLQGLRHLRYRGELCDTRVTVKGQEFLCHRLILIGASDYFKTSLVSEDQTSWHMTVENEDVSPKAFRLLLDILYGGSSFIDQETALAILECSANFRISFITKYIERYLMDYLKPENCIDVWLVAQKYKLIDLADKSYWMTAENMDKIPEHKLLSLHKSMLLILLSLQEKLSMDDVCKTILRWVEADQASRADFLCHFLPFVSSQHLPLGYLAELIKYRNRPSYSSIFDHVEDRIYSALKNSNDKCVHTQTLIQSHQSLPLDGSLIPVSLIVKTTEFPLGHGPALEAWRDIEERYILAPVPESTGCHFATCTWQNELYLSGGTLLPTFFAVYRPCDNQWSVLSALDGDGGREKHAMAAVNDNIYSLGGLMRTSTGDKMTLPDVWKYDAKFKNWSLVCRLPEAVSESSAAVLAHRIYLFGGLNARAVKSDLVQCVDTVNNTAYIAGKLPFSTCRSRALSNKGILWVVLRTGQVLQMWEDFRLAEQKEQHLAITKNRNTTEEPIAEPARDQDTVAFREVTKISVRDHFGACIGKREITVASGKIGNNFLISDLETIDLVSGQVKKCATTCITDAKFFDLHKINIPHVHLQKKTLSLEIENFSSRSSDRDSVFSVIQSSPFSPSHAFQHDQETRREEQARSRKIMVMQSQKCLVSPMMNSMVQGTKLPAAQDATGQRSSSSREQSETSGSLIQSEDFSSSSYSPRRYGSSYLKRSHLLEERSQDEGKKTKKLEDTFANLPQMEQDVIDDFIKEYCSELCESPSSLSQEDE